jgi:hypothetical protein
MHLSHDLDRHPFSPKEKFKFLRADGILTLQKVHSRFDGAL